jgi:hypothetical protein
MNTFEESQADNILMFRQEEALRQIEYTRDWLRHWLEATSFHIALRARDAAKGRVVALSQHLCPSQAVNRTHRIEDFCSRLV